MKTLESRTAIWRLWKINTNRQTVEGKQNLKNNQFVGQPIPVMQVLLFFMSPNSQPELKGNPNPGTAEQEWKERCETSLLYLVKQYEWRGWGQLHVGLRENPVLFFFFFFLPFSFSSARDANLFHYWQLSLRGYLNLWGRGIFWTRRTKL